LLKNSDRLADFRYAEEHRGGCKRFGRDTAASESEAKRSWDHALGRTNVAVLSPPFSVCSKRRENLGFGDL